MTRVVIALAALIALFTVTFHPATSHATTAPVRHTMDTGSPGVGG